MDTGEKRPLCHLSVCPRSFLGTGSPRKTCSKGKRQMSDFIHDGQGPNVVSLRGLRATHGSELILSKEGWGHMWI